MKTLYVHIGQPKTATTTLQSFFLSNRAALAEKGLAYPVMPFRYPFVTKARNGHFLIERGTRANGWQPDERQAQLQEQAYALIAEAFESHDAVLLSDERLWDKTHAGMPLWEQLLAHAHEHDYRVHVIVYLRRQDTFAQSWHNQMVQQGTRTGALSWERWIERPRDICLDYYENLERIAAHVGKANITVRVYDRARLAGVEGGIHGDFLSCVGLSLDETLHVPARDNNTVTLTADFEALLSCVNSSPRHMRCKTDLFRQAAEHCSAHPGDTPRMQMFSAEQAAAFVQRYEAGNRRIAREYLHTDEPLFCTEFAEVMQWSPANPWFHDDLCRYFARVAELEREQLARPAKRKRKPPVNATSPDEDENAPMRPQTRRTRETNADLNTAYYLGEFFLTRQERIEAGEKLQPLDSATLEGIIDAFSIPAREVARFERTKREVLGKRSTKVARALARVAHALRWPRRALRHARARRLAEQRDDEGTLEE